MLWNLLKNKKRKVSYHFKQPLNRFLNITIEFLESESKLQERVKEKEFKNEIVLNLMQWTALYQLSNGLDPSDIRCSWREFLKKYMFKHILGIEIVPGFVEAQLSLK